MNEWEDRKGQLLGTDRKGILVDQASLSAIHFGWIDI